MALTGWDQTTAARVLAWGALAALVYVYFLYPLLLIALERVRRPGAVVEGDERPTVTVVVAAWNEESAIGAKIENTLGQDYPHHLLDVVVVSDSSTDRTDEIVAGYARRTGRVRLLRGEPRQGKSAALNLGIPAAGGDVIVLTDANASFRDDAVSHLVGPFADPHVGAVSGQLLYRTPAGGPDTESVYWRYEQRVKRAESALHALLGANGSIYAIRRHLFRPIHPRDVNDFRIPYDALLQGYAVVLEEGAVSYEDAAPGLWAEYRRKVRIMSRAIPMMLSLIVPTIARGRGLVLWQLISHKVLREIQGIFFLAALLAAGWGAARGAADLLLLLAAQGVLYLAGVLGWAVPKAAAMRPLRLAAHFDMIALASIAALVLWATGQVRPTWEPARPSNSGA